MSPPTDAVEAVHGAILGAIVGDAMGLPYEGLSRRRAERLLGPPDRHRFVFARGMMSDDGEHTCIVAQCLCEWGGDTERFRRCLARRLRWWLLGLPAGVGSATLRAIVKLWLGFGPYKSGVYSAGNGPAMRSAVLGAAVRDLSSLRQVVLASSTITHTDPKAFHGAFAVALAARCAAAGDSGPVFLNLLRSALASDDAGELIELLDLAQQSAAAGEPTARFAERIGCGNGVSGYVYGTVPVAVHAWLRHPTSYAAAVAGAIECGGDTDTVAAIAGGIVGSGVGVAGIPVEWRSKMLEWPRSEAWVAKLASSVDAAASGSEPVPAPGVSPAVLLRNMFFLLVVIAHLCRRALPPY